MPFILIFFWRHFFLQMFSFLSNWPRRPQPTTTQVALVHHFWRWHIWIFYQIFLEMTLFVLAITPTIYKYIAKWYNNNLVKCKRQELCFAFTIELIIYYVTIFQTYQLLKAACFGQKDFFFFKQKCFWHCFWFLLFYFIFL